MTDSLRLLDLHLSLCEAGLKHLGFYFWDLQPVFVSRSGGKQKMGKEPRMNTQPSGHGHGLQSPNPQIVAVNQKLSSSRYSHNALCLHVTDCLSCCLGNDPRTKCTDNDHYYFYCY